MTTRRQFLSLAAALSTPLARAALAAPVHLLVGFAPGGQLDAVARLLSSQMKSYAPTVLVENRPGAGGRLALGQIKAARADGSSFILTPASMMVLYPQFYRKLGYDVFSDFTPVTAVCSFPFLITTGPMVGSDVKTLPEFVQWCRAHPKLASYGTAAAGSMLHFAGVSLAQASGVELLHVPYGGPGGIQDLVGGRLAATIYPIGTALPHVQSGRIRALATTGPARSPALPGVPTVAEAGFPGVQSSEWFGMFLPGGAPARVAEELQTAVRSAVESEESRIAFGNMSVDPAVSSPDEFARLLRSDFDRWGPIVRTSGFTPED